MDQPCFLTVFSFWLYYLRVPFLTIRDGRLWSGDSGGVTLYVAFTLWRQCRIPNSRSVLSIAPGKLCGSSTRISAIRSAGDIVSARRSAFSRSPRASILQKKRALSASPLSVAAPRRLSSQPSNAPV